MFEYLFGNKNDAFSGLVAPEVLIYYNHDTVFVCSFIFSCERMSGPALPIKKLSTPLSTVELHDFMKDVLALTITACSTHEYEKSISYAFQEMQVRNFDQLEKKYNHISIEAANDKLYVSDYRAWKKGGYYLENGDKQEYPKSDMLKACEFIADVVNSKAEVQNP